MSAASSFPRARRASASRTRRRRARGARRPSCCSNTSSRSAASTTRRRSPSGAAGSRTTSARASPSPFRKAKGKRQKAKIKSENGSRAVRAVSNFAICSLPSPLGRPSVVGQEADDQLVESVEVNGLLDVCVAARSEREVAMPGRVVRGDDDDGHVAYRVGLPDEARDGEAVQTRELQVHEDEVWALLLRNVHGLLPVARLDDAIALHPEEHPHHQAYVGVVFGDEYLQRAVRANLLLRADVGGGRPLRCRSVLFHARELHFGAPFGRQGRCLESEYSV